MSKASWGRLPTVAPAFPVLGRWWVVRLMTVTYEGVWRGGAACSWGKLAAGLDRGAEPRVRGLDSPLVGKMMGPDLAVEGQEGHEKLRPRVLPPRSQVIAGYCFIPGAGLELGERRPGGCREAAV